MCLPTDSSKNNRKDGAQPSPASRMPTSLVGMPTVLSAESYSLLLLLASALFYSVMAAYIKLAAATGIPSTELVFLRAIFQGILVVLAMCFFRDNHDTDDGLRLIWVPFGTPEIRWVVVARGVVGGMGFLFYYYTISALPLGDATTLLSLNPIITVLAASVVLGEPVRSYHIVAALGSIIGCVLIAKPSFIFGQEMVFDDQQHSSTGYITALLGTCCGATVYILIRRAGKGGVHTLQLLFSWVFFGTLFSLLVGVVLPLASGTSIPFVWPSTAASWEYILGACVFGSMGHLLMNYAARHAPAGLASIMRSSGILWSYALELLVFHEIPQTLTIAGASLIVLSLATIAIVKHQENQQSRPASSIASKQETVRLYPPTTTQSLDDTRYGSTDMERPH